MESLPRDRLMRTQVAANYIKVSEATLRKLVRKGIIPTIQIGRNTSGWLFEKQYLDKYLRDTSKGKRGRA